MTFNQREDKVTEGQGLLTVYGCKLCHICGAPNSTSYCRCRAIFYCKPIHAELDRSNHEQHCGIPLYSIRKGLKGKPEVTLVANKNIQPGQIILNEYPLICGPGDNAVDTNKSPTCLGCCVRNTVTKRKKDPKLNTGVDRCSACGWPVCSGACEKAYQHAVNECKYFKENNIKYQSDISLAPFRNKYFLYKGILVLRFLLLRVRDPKSFQEFCKLPARGNNPDTIKHTRTHDKLIFKLLQDFQAISLLSSGSLPAEEELSFILDRLCLYGFAKTFSRAPNTSYTRNKGQVDAVYRCGSVIKRACNSNVTWDISEGPDFVFCIRASKFIQKNEELVLPYSADLYMQDTQQRQEHIKKVIGTPCHCSRCIDRTEFGSFFSAVRCHECKNGYFLPSNPVDKTSRLVCSVDSQHTISPNQIYNRVKEIWKISSDIIESSPIKNPGAMGTNSAELKTQVKLLQSENFLHPHHSIMFRLVWEIVKRDIYYLPSLGWTELSEFINYCEYLGKIEELIGQVSSHNRAVLYFYMGRAFYQQYEMVKMMKTKTDTLVILEDIMNLYDEARKIFKDSGHEIGRIIHEDMKTIVSIINRTKNLKPV